MPSIPKLNTCCCCLSIETGVKILGYVETIIGFLGALIYTLALAGVIDLEEKASPSVESFENKVSATVLPSSLPSALPSALPTNISEVEERAIEALVVLVIGTLFVAVVGLLLLLGAYKRNASLVKISLIGRCILLAYYVLGFLINLIAVILGHETQFLAQIILFVLVIYNTLIVYSFYLDIQGGTGVY